MPAFLITELELCPAGHNWSVGKSSESTCWHRRQDKRQDKTSSGYSQSRVIEVLWEYQS